MDDVDDAEGPLDPRIQIELENLNNATDDINKLEIELDEAHTAYKQLLSECAKRLTEMSDKVGTSCIEKARCYFEALEVAQKAQVQCQQQAQLFQRASEIHAAAKETVALAEARFMSHRHEWNFDQAWQDMLNHATIKVMDAENQKAECGREHHKRAMLFHDAKKKAQQLEEKHRRSIIKATAYFEVLAQCDQMIATQTERIEFLRKAVKEAKRRYSMSLRALEEISNQIHEQRRDYAIIANGPREPGVGAELISPAESLHYQAEINKIGGTKMDSGATSELDTDDRDRDLQDVLELKERMEKLDGRSVDGSESTSSQWELELQASMEKLNKLPLNKTGENFYKYEAPSFENYPKSEGAAKGASSETSSNSKLDFHVFKKPSFINGSTLQQYKGWQSLTQSPINSILTKSKILKDSISKSLNNSPINMGNLTFGKSKTGNFNGSDNDHVPKRISPHEEQESQTIDSNEVVGVPKEVAISSSSEISLEKVQKQKTNFISQSADSSPIKNASDLTKDFVKSAEFKKQQCRRSNIKEIPLLSMLASTSSFLNHDRSGSMINLVDKENLNNVLHAHNTTLGNPDHSKSSGRLDHVCKESSDVQKSQELDKKNEE